MAKSSREAKNERFGCVLVHVPAKSPDLNPVEKMWGWIRRQMRAFDLEDLRNGRPVLGKTAYRARMKCLLRSARALVAAKGFYLNLWTAAGRVVKSGGHA